VSTDTRTTGASAATTGTTRAASVSGATGSAPGRVDSPPTSMMSAPAATRARAWTIADSGSGQHPPSENESGVTFTTPMINGCTQSILRLNPRRPRGSGPGRKQRAVQERPAFGQGGGRPDQSTGGHPGQGGRS